MTDVVDILILAALVLPGTAMMGRETAVRDTSISQIEVVGNRDAELGSGIGPLSGLPSRRCADV